MRDGGVHVGVRALLFRGAAEVLAHCFGRWSGDADVGEGPVELGETGFVELEMASVSGVNSLNVGFIALAR